MSLTILYYAQTKNKKKFFSLRRNFFFHCEELFFILARFFFFYSCEIFFYRCEIFFIEMFPAWSGQIKFLSIMDKNRKIESSFSFFICKEVSQVTADRFFYFFFIEVSQVGEEFVPDCCISHYCQLLIFNMDGKDFWPIRIMLFYVLFSNLINVKHFCIVLLYYY